ncbi:MAG: SAM-dependent methyltransferase [Thermomicrobiales bacterium]
MTQICFSAHEAYLPAAIEELRAVFPDAVFTSLGPDLGAIAGDGVSIVSVHEAVTAPNAATPVAFVQHLFREVSSFPLPTDFERLGVLLDEALETWQQTLLPETVSLQVWASVAEGEEAPALPVRMDELWRLFADGLSDEGLAVQRAGTSHVLSVCVTPEAIVLGSNRAENALSDWPGGRIRLSKPKGQISRSEFKLEELMRGFGVRFPEGRALDLGAAPGGWTRILRGQGLQVTAVDPGNLDPRIAGERGVTHVRKTAAVFLRETSQQFDVVVNDMRMAPSLSVDLMLTCWAHLNPGGMIVVTLKLSPHHAVETVRQSVMRLRQRYDIELVRQLQHNRNEVTVVGRRRQDGGRAG